VSRNGKMPELPSAPEAEEAVIGSLLLDPGELAKIVPILGATGKKFTLCKLGTLYEALVEMDARKNGIDLVTLTDFLDRKPSTVKAGASMLFDVGGPDEITALINKTPTSIHAEHYAKAIRDAHTLRQVIGAALDITKLAYKHQDDPDFVLTSAEKLIFDIRNDQPGKVRTTRDLGIQYQQQLARKLENPNYSPGFRTNIVDLDRILGGLERNRLVTIAARPGFGKTALATYVAWEFLKQRRPVLFFSLEMSSAQMMNRLVALATGINSDRLKKPRGLEPEEMGKVQHFLGEFIDGKYPLYLAFGARDVMEVRAHARRANAQAITEFGEPLALVVVDYLQLLSKTPGSNAERRDLEVGEMSRTLKLMSLEDDLNCTCIEVSQLSRAVEGRPDKRPILSDLRDSGSLEQDSDIVIFNFPPLAYETDDKRRRSLRDYGAGWEPLDLMVAKNRDGAIGTAKCTWRRDCGQIRSSAQEGK
jgi:replicative DNA helicase